MSGEKGAQPVTAAANSAVADRMALADERDFQDAARGMVAPAPRAVLPGQGGFSVWDPGAYAFEDDPHAPDTVNPSLWRQARLNKIAGLFEVTERVYQLRGMDISNMTIIEGDAGVIVIDPLIATQTARAALRLYREHRGGRPVTAVIYTHSHTDHYGGVKAVVPARDVAAGRVRIYAPAGFNVVTP